jgi:hypothetical protein
MNARELRAQRAAAPARRTYLCLEHLRRKPTDYEITSTGLLYHVARGFEVETPTLQHYATHGRGQLSSAAWDSLHDPAEYTYRSYVAERRDQEAFLDRLLQRPAAPVPEALRPLLGLLSAWRFPLHGMQMLAAYVGAFAPSGRIAIAATFQAADELRGVQRLCQWLSRSAEPAAKLDVVGRAIWQEHPKFQAIRRLVEELLVKSDWAEVLVALNGLLKPICDRLWFEHVARVAERSDDEVLEKILSSLGDDGRWHERWFVELAQLAGAGHESNRRVMRGWVATLRPRVAQAGHDLLAACDGLLGDERERAQIWRALDAALAGHLTSAGIAADGSEQVRA